MFSRLQKQFGTVGLVVAIVALIAGLAGGAYAAGKVIITNKNQIAAKVRKELKGKRGPAGKQGPAGPAGAAGPAGPKGDKGDPGAPGPSGKNVVIGTAGAECPEGGATVEAEGSPASRKSVCSGEEGPPGQPWTVGGTLPEGATETGVWSFGALSDATTSWRVPLTFNIQLAEELEGTGCTTVESGHVAATCEVHYINPANKEVVEDQAAVEIKELDSQACTGTAAAPTAAAGHLCVYAANLSNTLLAQSSAIGKASATEDTGASVSGAVIKFGFLSAGARGSGTWAVTGGEQ